MTNGTRATDVRPLAHQRTAAPKRSWAWFADMPTTNVRIFVSLLLVIATGFRYLVIGAPNDDFAQWLIFLGALAGIDSLTVVGKRATADAQVITAEAAARQSPSPDVLVSDGPRSIEVLPQPGAEPGDPPVGP